MPNLQNPIAYTATLKKTWAQPKLVLISTSQISAKNIPQIREATGHYISLPSVGYRAFQNAKGTRVVTISSNSVQHHHKSSFAS